MSIAYFSSEAPHWSSIGAVLTLSLCATFSTHAADTGDAPASYGSATHEVVAGAPYLGETPPDDNIDFATNLADGDDSEIGVSGAVLDDEDGVFAFPVLVQNGKAYTTNVFASNPTNTDATLLGWIDFNGDGLFSADEGALTTVPAGAENIKFKLLWNGLVGVTTDFVGPTFARFRISSNSIGVTSATGSISDGEVEDYTLEILADADGDEIPDRDDTDNDNDGIPDAVEGENTDTDADGQPDRLDRDSDSDGIADFIEAGPDASRPADSDQDGIPDYLDLDSDNDGVADSVISADDADGDGIVDSLEGQGDADGDGILNRDDIDSDNDLIPDGVEGLDVTGQLLDTDNDRVPDFLDLDSDNDGVTDLREAQRAVVPLDIVDAIADGRVDSDQVFGTNGFADSVETVPDSGVPIYAIADSDDDGMRDYIDLDSDNDGAADAIEVRGADADGNGLADEWQDSDGDGIDDLIDSDIAGGTDMDADGIIDEADVDAIGGVDSDGDGIPDTRDSDANGDGLVDAVAATFQTAGLFPNAGGGAVPDFQNADVVGDGTTPSEPLEPPSDDSPGSVGNGRVQTGLSGVAGCSTQALFHRSDISLLLLLFGVMMLARSRGVRVKHSK